MRDKAAFAVSLEREGSVATVACSGELDISSSERLQEALDDVLRGGVSSVLVDCRSVPFVDSTGIRRLLQFSRECERAQIDLLVLASEQLRKVASVLGVSEAVRIDGSRDDASPS